MRSSKSRSRGNKNRSNRPTGGNIINRVFDSSGPDGKVRGTPQQIIEKYNQLHRDAQLSNDRVNAENFSQHAEHYTRMLAEAQREVDKVREEQEEQNRQRQADRDRERTQRLKAQEEASSDGPSSEAEPGEGQAAAAEARPQEHRRPPRRRERKDDDQPAVDIRNVGFLQADAGEEDSGLVETPEAKAEEPAVDKPRRPRRPRKKPDDSGEAGPQDGGQSEAAE